MNERNEVLWIKKSTKDRLYSIKGRKTFSMTIDELLDKTEPKQKTKPNKWMKI